MLHHPLQPGHRRGCHAEPWSCQLERTQISVREEVELSPRATATTSLVYKRHVSQGLRAMGLG